MIYLIDTGVLLRLLDRNDPHHGTIRLALRNLKDAGHSFAVSPQNVAEFWSVSTRPATARGGYGLSIGETERRLRVLERMFPVLPENQGLYPTWRKLVVSLEVRGVQVHDARLVAWMETLAIKHVITLNPDDFSRYRGITVETPAALCQNRVS